MTLVASVSPFGCPLMLGDILISGQPDPQTKRILPTIGEFHLADDSVVDLSQVAWFAQKLCIIRDDLAVGWAGRYEPAKRIISCLRNHPWENQITLDSVQECLATTNYEDQAAVSLVGILSHRQGFGEFGLNAPKSSLPIFNQCRIIGSGRRHFIDVVQGISGLEWRSDDAPARSNSRYPKAAATTLATCAALVGEEMNTYGGLQHGFGGMFELIVYQEHRFRKLDDILYCFWAVIEYSKTGLTLAPHTTFVKVNYQNDAMVVRRSDFGDQRQIADHNFIIGPTAKQLGQLELERIKAPDLNSVHDCHYIVVQVEGGYDVLSVVNLFGRDSLVHFHRRDDGLVSFAVKGELLRRLHERVVARFYGQPS